MSDDLIERLAREAGLDAGLYSWPEDAPAPDRVRRFAALVAEECAKLADDPAECLRIVRGQAHPRLAAGAAIRVRFGLPREE